MSKMMTFLEKNYLEDVLPKLKEEFSIANPHLLPKIEKIVVSMRFGQESGDKKAIQAGIEELSLINGKKPAYSKAKKSVSTFRLRQGQLIGAYCTLRGKEVYRFLENLIYISLPRIRDFRGFNSKMFDSNFNFNFGISDHLIFQELSYDKVYKNRGLDISMVLKNIKNKDVAVRLLQGLNFPIKN